MNDYQERLNCFEQQIVEHPQLASSYATNGFLEALVCLNGEAINSNNIELLKKVIRAFTIVLPPVFLTICKNETETQMWSNTEQLLQTLQETWIHHANTGVRLYAFKCLQLLILLESKKEKKHEDTKDIFSLNFIRPAHKLMNVPNMEREGLRMVDVLLDRIGDKNENSTVITAIISCLTQLAKRRPQFTRAVIGALVAWSKNKPVHLESTDLRNIEKSIKLAFITMTRTNRLSAFRSELANAFTAVGGNPSTLQIRPSRSGHDRHDEMRRKRGQVSEGDTERSEKKAKTTDTTFPQMSSYAPSLPTRSEDSNMDISSIPLNVVVNLCVAVLQNLSVDTLNERFKLLPESMFRPSTVSTQQPPSFTTSTISTAPAEVEQNAKQLLPPFVKNEPSSATLSDADLELSKAMMNSTGARPPSLASVEERAHQALKMQPYNLADLQSIPDGQRLELLKMSMHRLLDANYFAHQPNHQASTVNNATISAKRSSPQNTSSIPRLPTWDSTAKMFWASLISKLFTIGTTNGLAQTKESPLRQHPSLSDQNPDQKSHSVDSDNFEKQESDAMKESLLKFILEDFPNRYDLALAWLYEERYYDMQCTRQHLQIDTLSPNERRKHTYNDWLLRLLEGGITALTNPKEKTLTKLLLAAPSLNEAVIEKIYDVMQEQQTNRFVMCVATLRDLAAQRPTVRARCLSILLTLCTDPDIKSRSTAITAVKRWVPFHPISTQVERHAINSLQLLLSSPPLSPHEKESSVNISPSTKDATLMTDDEPVNNQVDKKDDDEASEPLASVWAEQDVVRHTDLFFALCTKNQGLLVDLFPVYIKADQQVQRFIRQHIYNLITTLGIGSDTLIDLIKDYQPGSETLILRILKILCDTAPTTPILRALVRDIYVRKGLRAKFMLPIFTNQI
ncbi:hypothetical protein BCR42DRAFT_421270 [Absidia repens]|uniref:Symplekin/Pta1 N-terminal domain-containing protein n=1 Tax=Absidia repens TaxID=90262 RepID=A0A1X2I8I0_9FUNG|nr:hypothetical protein BCR42DRAFT_421270 [Absidia repens]